MVGRGAGAALFDTQRNLRFPSAYGRGRSVGSVQERRREREEGLQGENRDRKRVCRWKGETGRERDEEKYET